MVKKKLPSRPSRCPKPTLAANLNSHKTLLGGHPVYRTLASCLLLGALASAQSAAPPKTHLKVGDPAPDFAFSATSAGQPFQLSSFKGNKTVVVAFFPAAFTGG